MLRKRIWTTKLAGATALMMMLSIAMPLLAFAKAYIFEGAYDLKTGTVTASVYTDESVTGNVYLDIMDADGNVIDSVYLEAPTDTYTVGETDYDRYDFTYTVSADVYDRLLLTSWYVNGDGETVTSDTYEPTVFRSPDDDDDGNGGGGRGGSGSAPVDTAVDGMIRAGKNGSISESGLARELANQTTVTVELQGGFVLLPADVLRDAPKGRVLVLSVGGVTLELPLYAIDYERLAADVGTELSALTIRADIAALAGEELGRVEAAAAAATGELRSDAVSFMLEALGEGDRRVAIDRFDGVYVSRTIPVEGVASAGNLTGVVYDEATKELVFVPTELVFDESGAVVAAKLKRPANSVYAVLERTKTFADIAGHWAQEEIEHMAGKLIVEGVEPQSFQPNRHITRAEFATLLVRSLGLPTVGDEASVSFSDVSAGDWYADAVETAAAAKLIYGYPNGTFQPNATITRAEMAAMIVRAIGYVDTPPQAYTSPNAIEAALARYEDRSDVGWARESMGIAVIEGIIEGMSETSLSPNDNATRAQATVMLQRWMKNLRFIH